MKTQIKKYTGFALASTIVIGGIASAAIIPIPTISNTFAVAGQVVKSADINKLAEALNILDTRTSGTAPTEPNHLADKEYVDSLVPKWVDVPLTDTADFNPKCIYKLNNSTIVSFILSNKIKYINDWNDDGIIETIVITSTDKGHLKSAYWNGAGTIHGTETVSSMSKYCLQ